MATFRWKGMSLTSAGLRTFGAHAAVRRGGDVAVTWCGTQAPDLAAEGQQARGSVSGWAAAEKHKPVVICR